MNSLLGPDVEMRYPLKDDVYAFLVSSMAIRTVITAGFWYSKVIMQFGLKRYAEIILL